MRAISTITISLVLLLAPLAGAQGAQVINLDSRIRVGGGGLVTLRDLAAQGNHLEPALARALGRVTVAAAPGLGGQVTLTGSRVRALWAQAAPAGVSVNIPASLILERPAQTVSAQRLEDIFLTELDKRLGAQAGDADIHSLQVRNEIKVPQGQLSWRVRLLGGGHWGRVPAVITLLVDGRAEATVRVAANVDRYGPVVVATHGLPRGHVICEDDLRVARLNLSRLRGSHSPLPEDFIGQKVNGAVGANEPLDLGRVRRVAVIKRGDVVNMVIKAPGFLMTAKGKAAHKGYRGGRIRLTNLASKREVYGKVLDSGTVVVDF